MTMSSAKQLKFPDGYKELQERVDRMIIQLGHLCYHASATHSQETIEYWSKLLKRQLVQLSFDLEEADQVWRHDELQGALQRRAGSSYGHANESPQ